MTEMDCENSFDVDSFNINELVEFDGEQFSWRRFQGNIKSNR